MRLEKATADDIPTLVEFWYALASEMEHYSEFNVLVYDDSSAVPEDGFRRHLERDEFTDYLIEEGDELVGLLTTRIGEHPSREYSNYLSVVNLFITERHRNQGYGSAVISRVKQLARKAGCDHLKVSCEWENDGARRFYDENGFEEKQVTFVQQVE
ncbi:GCN5-like N-acetyltransferase [Haloferax mucosum ATCC BAA-1512]|uniref:GCN5-like N-acetyltransferase n=1 Tax=Haloferax mucosum ATCC BAA-1512 TaxID=662479 RepID=M0I3B1_9EURY|nr:GNAT family N-acetyltransferase [Haloferax mucosum]ELZ91241.1 GCN5-like N-acetyltransferase [Haloferax mucosum ATCC BAA-1512]